MDARRAATGGHLIVSVLHPFQALLGWHAPFEGEPGERRFVREYPHSHADYLNAFRWGIPPHGGFALGLERFVAQATGVANVREVTLFPRDRTRLGP